MSALPTGTSHRDEIDSGSRFAFGNNWTRFLNVLDEHRINEAVNSIRNMLDVDDLKEKTFLDIGSGSGLFSLAAKLLGAKVFSFDYDPQSVACTHELKKTFFPNDNNWTIQRGSVLDIEYLKSLGTFDIVYSWGVLHHTGNMWAALENIDVNVAENGKLFISLYNNQGGASKRWLKIKQFYNWLPESLRGIFSFFVYAPLELRSLLIHVVRCNPMIYFNHIKEYKKNRGMSWWHDQIDWIGGYPFEVSAPDEIFDFYKTKNYTLVSLKTCAGGHGCNEFVFQRNSKLNNKT